MFAREFSLLSLLPIDAVIKDINLSTTWSELALVAQVRRVLVVDWISLVKIVTVSSCYYDSSSCSSIPGHGGIRISGVITDGLTNGFYLVLLKDLKTIITKISYNHDIVKDSNPRWTIKVQVVEKVLKRLCRKIINTDTIISGIGAKDETSANGRPLWTKELSPP